MKIGLIFPNKDRRYKTVHLGLGYLAAFARKNHSDLEFQVLDTRVASSKETDQFFNTSFDLIGITVFSPVYFEVIQVFNRIKKIDAKIPVCLGGPYVTTIKDEIFEKTPAEFAVYGEGEITFSELLFHLKGQRDIKDIDGLMYQSDSGEINTNPARKQIQDIDNLSLPAYDLFPMDRYPLHRMVTSRGCPYSCAFCNSSSIWSGSWRKRSPINIIEEIEYLIENYGKKIFVFGDNSLNIDMARIDELCDLLIDKKTKILWSASIRADKITQPLANKMKQAGCYNVAIGIESANNEILSKIDKQITIEDITEGIKIFKQAGIEVLGQFVIGSPHDTLETVQESFDYAKSSECDFVNFYSVLPFKGTPQWEYVSENGRFFTEVIHDFHSINPRIVFETPEFSYDDRLKAINIAKKEGFYSNSDKKNWWFDVAKESSRKMQNMLPDEVGEKLYMLMKSIYRMKIVKKNNY
ncbi:MAG: B12-binding domain-containing radical SAM protein [Bacteroidales bacterium]|nr:B12-binding domain-containing radical SAM protein [Bacteroidales bacterium]